MAFVDTRVVHKTNIVVDHRVIIRADHVAITADIQILAVPEVHRKRPQAAVIQNPHHAGCSNFLSTALCQNMLLCIHLVGW